MIITKKTLHWGQYLSLNAAWNSAVATGRGKGDRALANWKIMYGRKLSFTAKLLYDEKKLRIIN